MGTAWHSVSVPSASVAFVALVALVAPLPLSLPWHNGARFALGVTAIAFLVIGAGFLITPVSWAESVEIALTTPTARTDLRATYGGFDFMFGVFLALCAVRRAWHVPGLAAAALCLGGFASSRIAGYFIEGSLSGFMLALLGVELTAVAICGYLYLRRPRELA